VSSTIRGWFFLLACAAILTSPASAEVKGAVFESKGGATPLLVWDGTPAVIDIVNAKLSRDTALHGLEANAVSVAFDRLSTLKDAKRITVRLIYRKVGAVNPEYGGATLLGVERVFELQADANAVRLRHQALAGALSDGKVPAEVRIVMTGQLPPLNPGPSASPR
jgi:hypothetical protein